MISIVQVYGSMLLTALGRTLLMTVLSLDGMSGLRERP